MSVHLDTALKTAIAAVPNIATLAPGGIHNTVRPQGSTFPVVIFQLVTALDAQSFKDRGTESLDYDVKIIAPTNAQANVGTLLDAIHTALERVTFTLASGTHLQTLRIRRIPTYSESVNGVSYVHRGATYRLWTA